jgi:hypothetical protein
VHSAARAVIQRFHDSAQIALSWSPFHTRMACGLVTAWILDGLQITIALAVTGVLVKPQTLGMTSAKVGAIASVYLVGENVGALVFGSAPPRPSSWGRRSSANAGLGGVSEIVFGLNAEGKSLEDITNRSRPHRTEHPRPPAKRSRQLHSSGCGL